LTRGGKYFLLGVACVSHYGWKVILIRGGKGCSLGVESTSYQGGGGGISYERMNVFVARGEILPKSCQGWKMLLMRGGKYRLIGMESMSY